MPLQLLQGHHHGPKKYMTAELRHSSQPFRLKAVTQWVKPSTHVYSREKVPSRRGNFLDKSGVSWGRAVGRKGNVHMCPAGNRTVGGHTIQSLLSHCCRGPFWARLVKGELG